MCKVVLVGIGNIMFCDDGLGVYAADFIKQNFDLPSYVDVLDGGTLGFSMMTLYQEYEKVFIISTTSKGKSGEVFHFSKEELIAQGAIRQSANEVEVVQMLEICSVLDEDMAHVEIIAMKPDDILPVVANLTESVIAAFPLLIYRVVETLHAHDIETTPKAEQIPIEAIIHAYANPTQQMHVPHTKG